MPLDRLILELRGLEEAIRRLPPRTRGTLNSRIRPVLESAIFDSELLIEVVEAIVRGLRDASPKRLADDALSMIQPPLPVFKDVKLHWAESGRPPLIELWESIPAETRVEVERLMRQGPVAKSVSGWLTSMADLLVKERPAHRLGAPPSRLRPFVLRVASIWRRLGLKPGLAYDFFLHPGEEGRVGKGGRVQSGFQKYCRAALAAFANHVGISARQVENAKKTYRPPYAG